MSCISNKLFEKILWQLPLDIVNYIRCIYTYELPITGKRKLLNNGENLRRRYLHIIFMSDNTFKAPVNPTQYGDFIHRMYLKVTLPAIRFMNEECAENNN